MQVLNQIGLFSLEIVKHKREKRRKGEEREKNNTHTHSQESVYKLL